jgi:hypothetical protein
LTKRVKGLISSSKINGYAAPVTAIAIAALYLLAFAGDGLRAHLTGDDLMNSYLYWSHPIRQILAESVLFYPAEVGRPLGALFYRPLYALFGLNPLPYRIGCFALLLVNLVLVYIFCARLAKSREVAVLACALGAYHAHLGDLYYNSGTIYDLICCCLFYLSFIYYLQIRENARYPGLRQSLILLTLYTAALDAKEMAVILPVIVLVYELVYHPPKSWLSSYLRSWGAREGRFVCVSIPVTLAYIGSRIFGVHAAIANPAYHPNISLRTFMAGWRHYLSVLFYQQVTFNSAKVVMVWALLLILARIARRKDLLIAWFLIMLGVLPIIFIEPRGLYATYTVLPAWYLFAAVLLVMLRDLLIRSLYSAASLIRVRARQLALFVLVLLLLIPIHYRGKSSVGGVSAADNSLHSLAEQLTTRYPTMPHGARILFLSDPFDPDDWTLTFLLRLHYRDRDIRVDRVKMMGSVPDVEAQRSYHHIFMWTGAELTEMAN